MPSETGHVSDGISFAQPISFLLIYVKKKYNSPFNIQTSPIYYLSSINIKPSI